MLSCESVLESVSPVFATHLALETNSPYEIQANVCKASVIELVKLFQGKVPIITADIAYDLKTMCEELEIECFRRFVEEFIGLNKHEAIIDGIKNNFERCSEPTPLEQTLREDFIHFIDNDRLFELPLNCLLRNAILPPSPTPDQIGKFLGFFVKSLDHYGPACRSFKICLLRNAILP
jgi:hypothetical protein